MKLGSSLLRAGMIVALIATRATIGAAQVTHEETLAGLGFPAGIAMLNPTQPRDIFYHGTDGVEASNGKLHVDLTLSVQNFSYAFAQVLVNDVPRFSRNLGGQDMTVPVDVDLTPAELMQPFIKVTVRFGGRLTDDRCYDWRTNGSYITVGPASGVRYTYMADRVSTIDGAWSVLPRRVIVQLPGGALTSQLYRAAWQLGATLQRGGHAVTFSNAPAAATDSVGVAIVAPKEQLASLGAPVANGANIVVARVNGRATLVVTDTFPAAQLLGESWRHVAQGDQARVVASRAQRDVVLSNSSLSFEQLGLGSVQRDLALRAEWSFPFSVRDLSPNMIPARVNLDVVTGLSPDVQGTVGQVFVNDVLVRSTSINETGKPQRIAVDIPRRLLNVDNTLRLVVQRKEANSLEPRTGECRALPAPVPAEVLATSTIDGAKLGDLTQFMELPAALRGGFDVYLPKASLGDPTGTLPFLARLGSDVLPMADVGDVMFYDGTQPPDPKRLFVMIATPGGVKADGPARFENARLVIDGPKTQPVLDVAGRLNSTMFEIARVGGNRGLVIVPLGGALPAPPSLGLSNGDLAFASASGVDLVVDRRAGPNALQEGGLLGAYRYWIYAAVALLVAIALVYLLRRARAQRS